MDQKGWSMHRLGEPASPAAAAVGETTAADAPAAASGAVRTDAAQLRPTAGGQGAATGASWPARTDRQPSDPKRQLAVSSWWKPDAGPGDLEKKEKKCIAKLG